MLTRARKGFTLLELIVVLVILGLIAAIAIPTYQAVIDKTKGRTAKVTAEAVGREAVALAAVDRAGGDTDYLAAAMVDASTVSWKSGTAPTTVGTSGDIKVTEGSDETCFTVAFAGLNQPATVTKIAC